MKNPDYDKLIDCAAIRMPDGRVWTGKRHHHCFATIMQALGKPAHFFGKYEHGFVTMGGRFVDRKEAMTIALESGQVKVGETHNKLDLFSEDLY